MNAGDKNWNSITTSAILTICLEIRDITLVRNSKGGNVFNAIQLAFNNFCFLSNCQRLQHHKTNLGSYLVTLQKLWSFRFKTFVIE